VNGDIVTCDLKAAWQLQAGAAVFPGKIDIENAATFFAMEMAMFVHVRAITHRGAIEIDGLNEVATNQEIEAVVNGGHGDIRAAFFGPHKDLLGGRVIAVVEQHLIDLLALRGEAKPLSR